MQILVHSYYVGISTKAGDVHDTIHPLTDEYAHRADAKLALDQLSHTHPNARVYKWTERYDIDDPPQFCDYRKRISWLLATCKQRESRLDKQSDTSELLDFSQEFLHRLQDVLEPLSASQEYQLSSEEHESLRSLYIELGQSVLSDNVQIKSV